MSAIYLIDGKPHRQCECEQFSQTCASYPAHKRTMMTAGFARCLLPAPDVVFVACSESERTTDAEALLLHDVLNRARETLLVSIKGSPDELQRSLGRLNIACKAHWDWQTEKVKAEQAEEASKRP